MKKKSSSKRPLRTASAAKKNSTDFQISFADVLALVRRRAWLVALAGILGLLAGFAYFQLAPNKFESKSEILVERRDPTIALEGAASATGSDMTRNLMATHMRLVQSKVIVDAALKDPELTSLGLFDNLSMQGISPADYVTENLYVTTGDKDANSIVLRFVHTSPVESQQVLSKIVENYQLFLKEKYKHDSEGAVTLIDTARKELEDELKELEDSYREFYANAPILSSSETSSNVYESRYVELQAEISSVDYKIAEIETRLKLVQDGLKRMEETGKDDLQKLTLIDSENASRMSVLVSVDRGAGPTESFLADQPERAAAASLEYSALNEKRAKLGNLEKFLGKSHPEVDALRSEIAMTEKFIAARADIRQDIESRPSLTPNDVMTAYVALIENDLHALRDRKIALQKLSTDTEMMVRNLAEFETKAGDLLRERERKQTLYDSTVDTLRTLNLSSTAGSGFIHEVIEHPELGKPVSKTLASVAITIFTAMLFGVGFVFMAELSDRGVHKPQDLEEIFNAKILSHLPELFEESEVKEKIQEATIAGSILNPSLVTQLAPQSRISEAFRSLRTQVMFASNRDAKLFAVTSAKPGEGKSTIASNLATSIAQTGRQVILIDGDMRRPQVKSVFGLVNEFGLSEVLNEQVDLNEAIVPSGINNLSIMHSGEIPNNPAELLDGPNFDRLVQALRDRFEIVIFDCPPLLPVSDPSIIAAKADGIIVAVRVDKNTRPQSKRIVEILSGVGVKTLGIVVNRSESSIGSYSYTAYGYESSQAAREYYRSKSEDTVKTSS